MKKPNEDPIQLPVPNTTSSSQATREYIHEQLEEAIIRLRRADEDRIEPEETEETERGPSFQKLKDIANRAVNLSQRDATLEQQFGANIDKIEQLEGRKEELTRETHQKQGALRNITFEQRKLKTKAMSLTQEKQKLETDARILRQEYKRVEEEHKKMLEDLEKAKNAAALLATARQKAEAILNGQQPPATSPAPAILTQLKLTTHDVAGNSEATQGSPKTNNKTKDSAPMNPTVGGKLTNK
jgi:chromosome segregation ATPase